MSLEAVDWALRLVKNVSPTQKLILICLADQAGPNGTSWSSQSTVAEYSGLSIETIDWNLSELEKQGIIRSVHGREDGKGELSKTYLLNLQNGTVDGSDFGF